MYPNDGYAGAQQTRKRRSDRYTSGAGQASSAQGWQQPAYQQYPPQQGYQQPVQQSYSQRQSYSQYPPQQDYARGYRPQQEQWNHAQPRMNAQPHQVKKQPAKTPQAPKTPLNWKPIALAALVVAVLIVVVVAANNARQSAELDAYVATFDKVYCQNVYVDGIHLGGMTQQEAVEAVTAQAQQRNDAWTVQLTYQGSIVTELNASQLGMTVDVYEPLRQAWEQGHTGDTQQRLAAMKALEQEPYQAYSALPSGDTSVVDSVLAELKNKVYRAPQDAVLLTFNPESVTDPFTFQQEVTGRVLDTEPIKERIYQMVSTLESGSIEIEPTTIQPQVTVADLEKLVTLRGTASTTVSYRSTENRTNNIRRAFQLVSGTIIQPGETFSFNGIVGERSTENGFYEAVEYAYGEQVMGIGGGVCQASSTVYQAAVAAGMQITKREQHSLAVNYAEYGYDATVYWSKNRKIDLAFKNTSDSAIYIAASVQMDPNNRKQWIAKVSIYGADLGNVTYRLETDEPQVLEAPTDVKYVKDKKQEYVTYVDEEKVVQKASEGYVIDSYCVKYVDGVEVERTHLFTDRYEPKQKIVYVGVKERE